MVALRPQWLERMTVSFGNYGSFQHFLNVIQVMTSVPFAVEKRSHSEGALRVEEKIQAVCPALSAHPGPTELLLLLRKKVPQRIKLM